MAATHRTALPQLGDGLFLADGDIETALVSQEGVSLPYSAVFTLLDAPGQLAFVANYYRSYARIAQHYGAGLVLDSPTWRANPDWGARLGYTAAALADTNQRAIELLEEIRDEYETPAMPVVISGCIGPRVEGNAGGAAMDEHQARQYHRLQVDAFAATNADMLCAFTLGYCEEALGIARAAQDCAMPLAVSFTVAPDGRLPSGQPLGEALQQVDAATACYPSYYMVDCAHPAHIEAALENAAPWMERIRGLRANASGGRRAEHTGGAAPDAIDPAQFGARYAQLLQRLTRLTVLGGCSGTGPPHLEQVAIACAPLYKKNKQNKQQEKQRV